MKAGRLLEIIEEISQRDNLTLSDIAVKVNVNRSYLSKFINGDQSKDMTRALERKFTKCFPDYFKEGNKSHESISREMEENNTDSARLLKVLENLSIGHKEACESVNKMADNERMILLKIPTEGVHEGIVLTDPSILIPLAQVLAEISMGKLKFHTTEEALAELGIRLGLHKPYKGKTKGIHVDAGK